MPKDYGQMILLPTCSMHRRLKVISSRLEEVGITHIRNKEVILRNITNYQDTKALNDFTNIWNH
jgi:hexosaminidase